MTSRERLLAAISHRPTDRLPICFRGVAPLDAQWNGRLERFVGLARIGVDDVVPIEVPWAYHPDVRTHQRWSRDEAGRYVMTRTFETPAGRLTLPVRETDDFIVEEIPLRSDHAWSRAIRFPVNSRDDLKALSFLLCDPTACRMPQFRERAEAIKSFASTHGALVEGRLTHYAGLLGNLVGPEQMLLLSMSDTAFIEELLAMIHRWSMRQLELLLDLGVDVIYSSSAYETVELWSPESIRRLFLPLRKELADSTHQAGAKYHCFTQTGIMPLIEDFRDIGVDVLSALDPTGVGDEGRFAVDLATVKRTIGKDVCLWGGVDAEHTIELGTPQAVREAVAAAIEACGAGGGFVLSTSGSIYRHDDRTRENVMAFIDAARELGGGG